jgi:hypothetical protein
MNRRHLLNRAACFIPGGPILQGNAKESFSEVDLSFRVPHAQEAETILSPKDDKSMLDLFRICLERIDWQGDASEWQTRLLEALDRLESSMISETGSPSTQITLYQMDRLGGLCEAARTGGKKEILECALRVADAFKILFPAGDSRVRIEERFPTRASLG